MNNKMNIPSHILEIKKQDIPTLARLAIKEANPLYPVPKILMKKDMEYLLHIIGNYLTINEKN